MIHASPLIDDQQLLELAAIFCVREGLVAELLRFLRQVRAFRLQMEGYPEGDRQFIEPVLDDIDQKACLAIYARLSSSNPIRENARQAYASLLPHA